MKTTSKAFCISLVMLIILCVWFPHAIVIKLAATNVIVLIAIFLKWAYDDTKNHQYFLGVLNDQKQTTNEKNY